MPLIPWADAALLDPEPEVPELEEPDPTPDGTDPLEEAAVVQEESDETVGLAV